MMYGILFQCIFFIQMSLTRPLLTNTFSNANTHISSTVPFLTEIKNNVFLSIDTPKPSNFWKLKYISDHISTNLVPNMQFTLQNSASFGFLTFDEPNLRVFISNTSSNIVWIADPYGRIQTNTRVTCLDVNSTRVILSPCSIKKSQIWLNMPKSNPQIIGTGVIININIELEQGTPYCIESLFITPCIFPEDYKHTQKVNFLNNNNRFDAFAIQFQSSGNCIILNTTSRPFTISLSPFCYDYTNSYAIWIHNSRGQMQVQNYMTKPLCLSNGKNNELLIKSCLKSSLWLLMSQDIWY